MISVLLPARNASATLQEALRGVLAQREAPPFEVVCVDDASTDATPSLLAEAARRDARVRVVRGEGRGLVAALNLGLSHCTGELIARMDADDLVHPDRLRLQAELMESEPELGAAGSLVSCDAPGLARLEAWLNATVTKEQCRNARFIEAPLVHPSTIFRREALLGASFARDGRSPQGGASEAASFAAGPQGEASEAGWADRGWAEDWDLLLRLVERGWQLAKVPQNLLVWRDSEHRLTRTAPAYRFEQMSRLRAHYLARGPLRGRLFDVWGAGPSGKRLARELEAHGLRPRAFFDVDQSKQIARGHPVLREHDLPPPGDALMLCAVGAAGAREEIRAALERRGYLEGADFLFAA